MGEFTKFFSSSKREVLIGKTITKQIGDKTEFENTINVTNALKAAGMYDVFTYNPEDMTVTYDYIEGQDNQDVSKCSDAMKLVASYSKPIKAKLMRVDEMHKAMTGYVWDKRFYDILPNKSFNCLCHDDVNAVNIIKSSSGYAMIDWERASLGPHMYDMGSWLVNQTMYAINPKQKTKTAQALINAKLKGLNPKDADMIMRYALIDANFILSWKQNIAKTRRVWGIDGLKEIIKYLEAKYLP